MLENIWFFELQPNISRCYKIMRRASRPRPPFTRSCPESISASRKFFGKISSLTLAPWVCTTDEWTIARRFCRLCTVKTWRCLSPVRVCNPEIRFAFFYKRLFRLQSSSSQTTALEFTFKYCYVWISMIQQEYSNFSVIPMRISSLYWLSKGLLLRL